MLEQIGYIQSICYSRKIPAAIAMDINEGPLGCIGLQAYRHVSRRRGSFKKWEVEGPHRGMEHGLVMHILKRRGKSLFKRIIPASVRDRECPVNSYEKKDIPFLQGTWCLKMENLSDDESAVSG